MNRLILLIAVTLSIASCASTGTGNEAAGSSNLIELEIHDETGTFDGRKVGFEIVEVYPSGKPKEYRYSWSDTLLIHECLESGLIVRKYRFKGTDLRSALLYDSLGTLRKKMSVIDSLEFTDRISLTRSFESNGTLSEMGFKKNDSTMIGSWVLYSSEDKSKILGHFGINGEMPDKPVTIRSDSIVYSELTYKEGIVHRFRLE